MLVVIPAYNAAGHLPELLSRVRRYVPPEDVLVVDDGSTDDTASVLASSGVSVQRHAVNRGKGAALATGFRYAMAHGYRAVLTMDADLQHLPEEIPGFLAADDGRSLLMGTRAMCPTLMPWLRRLTNNLTSLIVSLFSRQRIRDSQSGFRLIPVWVLRRLNLRSVNYDLESELLFKAAVLGCPVREVQVSTVYEGSASYINPLVDTLRFIRQIWRRIWL